MAPTFGGSGRKRRACDLLSSLEHDEAALEKFITAVERRSEAAEAIDAGAVGRLVYLAEEGSIRQREGAATALGAMARTSSGHRVQIVNLGGLDAILKLVKSGSAPEKAAALVALEAFAVRHAEHIAQSPDNPFCAPRCRRASPARRQRS